MVGTCTLAAVDPVNRRAELGFALGREHQGRGHMAAALPAVLGFRREGMLREHYLVTGEPQDAVVYGLLQSEWPPSVSSVPSVVSCS